MHQNSSNVLVLISNKDEVVFMEKFAWKELHGVSFARAFSTSQYAAQPFFPNILLQKDTFSLLYNNIYCYKVFIFKNNNMC